ncbi:MAG: crossover junction endodeoxyribonuclease RuvC [Chloroflexaceae bacterium]|nr:crossover junction endodeoxyribonuclease RuvC [Chloroflexaceae bacterium]NJL33705.1 crossover junction endodeoxyribonuclease RuvC [Chloroflexaceae bacterium]NJO06290.1 crossover junction endodeoxyribonuclease RuvC [Chloroflexaceae bacterium]
MRILGIDPGTAILGWGVLDSTGATISAVAYGALTTLANTPPAERLVQLFAGLQTVLAQHRPDAAAIEELFFSRNVTTALAVGQARGVVLLAIAQAGVPIYEYKPREVKQAVVGYGGADKRQIQEMVRMTLSLATIPKPDDTADALAIALCHAYTAPAMQRIAAQL